MISSLESIMDNGIGDAIHKSLERLQQEHQSKSQRTTLKSLIVPATPPGLNRPQRRSPLLTH